MPTPVTVADLRDKLDTLAADLESTKIRIPAEPRQRAGDGARRSLLADIRRYFGTRLDALDAPLVIAVLGPSGVGVSTVVNGLAGEQVAPAGVLRPTTKQPAMWTPHSPPDGWWEDVKHRFGVPEGAGVVVGGPDTADLGWVLVDIPAALGPSEALDLAACADLCLFVNSPSRYADAEAAALALGLFERGVPTWYALNKLPSDAALQFEIAEAYAGLLFSWNLIESPSADLIDRSLWTAEGPIAPDALPLMRSRLASFRDLDARRRIVEEALAARLAAVSVRAEEVAEQIEDDRDSLMDLDALARDAYTTEADRLVADLESGEFAGLAKHSSWPEAAVDLTGVVTRRAGLAAHRATESWEATAAGRAVLTEGGGALRRHGEQAAFDGQGLLEAWQHELGEEAAAALAPKRVSKRKRARMASMLWPLVVDPNASRPRRLVRWLGSKTDEAVAEGRVRLGIAMVAAVARDADRFDDFLGPHPDVGRLGRIMTTAALLSEAELTGLDGAPDGNDPAPTEHLGLEIVVDVDEAEPTADDVNADLVAVPTGPPPAAVELRDETTQIGPADLPIATDPAGPAESGEVTAAAVTSGEIGDGSVMTSTLPEVPVFELPEVPAGPISAMSPGQGADAVAPAIDEGEARGNSGNEAADSAAEPLDEELAPDA